MCVRLALVFLVGLAVLAASGPAHAQKPRAERPTYQVGDKWIRSDGVYDLIRIEKDMYIFAAEGGRESHLTRDLALGKSITGGTVQWELDPPPRLTWPLEVGKWGISSTNIRTIVGEIINPLHGGKLEVTWKVEAYEDVQVAGGTFRAFRIIYTWQLPRGGGSISQPSPHWTLSTWYAPDVRQVVKAESNRRGFPSFQVVAVDRPGAAPLQVALADPKDQARVTSGAVVVAGQVTSGTGVSRVSVTLNGREVSKQEEKAPKKEVALNLSLKLQEGKNVLLVTATDSAGDTHQEARTLFYEKPGPPPAVAKP
ncbi:MAG: hypothetical protein WAP47_15595, partial [Candidatus Rokuibacteriota bacterium]